MRTPPLPVPALRPPWSGEVLSRGATSVLLAARHPDGRTSRVRLCRCAAGRLRGAYPVGSHDIEVSVTGDGAAGPWPDLLAAVRATVEEADPRCRRIVLALAVTAADEIAAAARAGFRPVVEVDLADAELVLMVAEPAWVGAADDAGDRVPGT